MTSPNSSGGTDKTQFRLTIGSDGSRAYVQFGATTSNGARTGQGALGNARTDGSAKGSADIEGNTSRERLAFGLGVVREGANAVDTTASAVLPQNGTDVAVSALVPVGGKAAVGALKAGAGMSMRLLAKRLGLSEGEIDALLGSYKNVRGHHVHAKAGFRGAVNYDPNRGFSISQDFMERMGWDHDSMTAYQRRAFNNLARSGGSNTMREHTQIAVDALVAGNVPRDRARALVAESLRDLRQQGVREPTRIPWNE